MGASLLWVAITMNVVVLYSVSVGGKSTIEPCDGLDTCNAMVGYVLPTDLKISEVATRFEVDPVSLLGANAIDLSLPDVENQILSARSFIRVPVTCGCVNGIRKVSSVSYKVRAADTLSSIAGSVFGGLITAEQLKDANSLSDPNSIEVGQSLSVPLPCSCFNGTDNGLPAIYLSYVVKAQDTISALALKYGTTVTDLMTVNALGTASIKSGDILSIPLAACASQVSKYSSDRGLIVANGSYAITASHCVQCICGGNLNLYCEPAPLAASCSSMQCKNSNLMIGNVTTQPTAGGCNVTTCSYNGFINGTILTSLQISLQPRCPAPFVTPNFTKPSATAFVAPAPAVSPLSRSSPRPALAPGASVFSGLGPAGGPTGSVSFSPNSLSRNPLMCFMILVLTLVHLIDFGK